MIPRRTWLKSALLAPFATRISSQQPSLLSPVKPPASSPATRLVSLPGRAPAYSRETVQVTIESLQALGFKTKPATHFYDRYGYLAGHDADRTADLNALFADPSVNAVLAMHGGWECARLDEYIKPLNVPAYSGAMIGHIADKFTIPVGLNAEIDATKGTIQLLESAVS